MIRTDLPTSVLLDRAAGALVGLAAGDALGAGYEATRPAADADVRMIGGGLGGFAPGEWTDDTDQAVAIAEVAATGTLDLDAIGQRFLDWYVGGPKDCGISTRAVLHRASGDPTALTASAAAYFADNPRGAAGNGALMRTAPVALAHLGDDAALVDAARRVAALTHGDTLAGEACVLWCVAIDRAIREGRLDGVRDGVELLPEQRRAEWTAWLDEADTVDPRSLQGNGFVVRALQAAHAAIVSTDVGYDQPGRHLAAGLVAAVRIGGDTDTVAAIAGQLLGARYGVSAVPALWRTQLHGWPGLDVHDLVALAVRTVRGGRTDVDGWPGTARMTQVTGPVCQEHPDDPELLLGNLAGLKEALGRGVTTVVSLCRTGTEDVPSDVEHVTVWLPDTADLDANPNLEQVLSDTVELLLRRRADGGRVYLHCAAGASRTPTVAALYAAWLHGRDARACWEQLADVLPLDPHNTRFQARLDRPVGDLVPDTSVDGPPRH